MFKVLKNAWSVPDLRKKILLVLALILVFRFGSFIPVPGINRDLLGSLWINHSLNLLVMANFRMTHFHSK